MFKQAEQPQPTVMRDLTSGLVVFFVALPLCLGVAFASDAPLFAGLTAGIVGGILVGFLSGSQTSVSGPAAGLTTIVAAQIALLGSFQAFQAAVLIAGVIQIVLGAIRAGFIAAFFPSSVIKGLLAAIGVILILKQIPHVLGHDPDPEGDMSFLQPDHENTISEFGRLIGDVHPGAAAVGLASIALLAVFSQWKPAKRFPLPASLLVVILGVGMSLLFRQLGGRWVIEASHLVRVPVADSLAASLGFLQFPDFSLLSNPAVYTSALTVAAVASLETLLNLEAVDKLDPQGRNSPPSRELMAQGAGNLVCGLIGGLPVTSVIARSSLNVHTGGRTKLAAIFHGVLLLVSVLMFPSWLNLIPLSCLAAILLVTGVKLASPTLVKQMWSQGRHQFVPFAATVVAIVLTDLIVGVLIGLAVSVAFILSSNVKRPIRRIVEKHLGGEVVHIHLAEQVSFLNRAALVGALDELPRGSHVLLDARNTHYIDPDLLDLIHDFEAEAAPARGVEVSLVGFKEHYMFRDRTQYVDYSTREIQSALTPEQVLQILKEGNERFRTGQPLTRDFGRQVGSTAEGQHPFAVVLGCIDSRVSSESVFDAGIGDVFSVRIAGSITSRKVLGSLEYACVAAGAKLILVMGHTRCGAVTAAVNDLFSVGSPAEATGCEHLEPIVREIQQSIRPEDRHGLETLSKSERESLIDGVARRNVAHVVETIRRQSAALDKLAREKRIAIVGAMYDVASGTIEFLPTSTPDPAREADLV